MDFIFDTGASNVCISLTEALYMLKNGYLSSNEIFGTSYAMIANGDITENTEILIREIVIGDIVLNNVRASIVHELKAPLLLGQSAISKLGKIQLDGNILKIYKNENYNSTNQPYTYTFKNNNTNNNSSTKQPVAVPEKEIDYKLLIGKTVEVTRHTPIYKEPFKKADTKSITKATDGLALILEIHNNAWFKVKVNNKVGFMEKFWIK